MGEARWVTPLPPVGAMRERVADALGEVADVCLDDANRTVPIEDGTLQGSGHTRLDVASLTSEVAYATPYAVVQHEDATLTHDAGRRSHWLELTVYENAERYEERIARAFRG